MITAFTNSFATDAVVATHHHWDDGGWFPWFPLVPLFFGQEVTATVMLAHVGTSSMRFEFEVWGEAFDGRPRRRAARGSYVTVHMSGEHGLDTTSPWPAAWAAALAR